MHAHSLPVSVGRRFYGAIPLVMRVIGDGQTCLTGSYVKRRWPDMYKHVLICNGNWHSSGHFQLQGITLFWWCVFSRCAQVLHKKYVFAQMKNLARNTFQHSQQFIFPVAVATVKYLVTRRKGQIGTISVKRHDESSVSRFHVDVRDSCQ